MTQINNNLLKGSYVGLKVSKLTSEKIIKHCRDIGIQNNILVPENKLHTTIINSSIHDQNIISEKYKHIATFEKYELFENPKGQKTILVIRLNSPSINKRHEYLMKNHDLIYDYSEFIPHITLSYYYTRSIRNLRPITFPIIFEEEYHECLVKNRNNE